MKNLKWTLEKVLINNIHAVDSTILKHNDKFWLFCNVMKNQSSNTKDELSLFYSENLNSTNGFHIQIIPSFLM